MSVTVTPASGRAIDLSSQASGVLAPANGGTGATAIYNRKLRLISPNGHGSSSTTVRRYSTVETNTLSADVTYADSSTLGMSVTVVTAGLYAVVVNDLNSGGTGFVGFTINAAGADLTAAIYNVTTANRVGYSGAAATVAASMSAVVYLAVGDIVRMQDDGNNTGTQTFLNFTMTRIL